MNRGYTREAITEFFQQLAQALLRLFLLVSVFLVACNLAGFQAAEAALERFLYAIVAVLAGALFLAGTSSSIISWLARKLSAFSTGA